LATVGTIFDPAHPLGPGCTIQVQMSLAPWSHMAKGGIDITASSRSSPASASMS
jgi:hypothetical protein